MPIFDSSVLINRPVEEVFAFVTEPGNSTLWQSGCLESVKTSEGPVGVGTTGREVRRFLGLQIETTGEVTDFEPNKRSSVKTTSGPAQGQATWTFESAGGGTTFATAIDVDLGGLFKLAGPVLSRMIERQIETDLANLKDLLEAQP